MCMWFAPCMFLLVSAFIFNQCFSNGNRLSWWMSRSYVYAFIYAHSTHLPIFLCSPSLLKHSNTEHICVYFVRDKKEKKTHTNEQQRKIEARVVVAKSAVNVYANYAPNEKKKQYPSDRIDFYKIL